MSTVTVPASIKPWPQGADPPADATRPLNEVLAKLKAGDTLAWPAEKVRYRVEGALITRDDGITIDAKGGGWKRSLSTGLPRTGDPWYDIGGDRKIPQLISRGRGDVTLKHATIWGPNEPSSRPGAVPWPAFVEELEGQAGIEIAGGEGHRLLDVRVRMTHGDGIRLCEGTRDVSGRQVRLDRIGRQGMALDGCSEVDFTGTGGPASDCSAWGIARSVFDIEPGGNHDTEQYGAVKDVKLAGWHVGYSMGKVLPMEGTGPNVDRISFLGNYLNGMCLTVSCASKAPPWDPTESYDRGDVVIEDNRSNIVYGSSVAFGYFVRCGLHMHRNYQQVATTQARLAVYADRCDPLDVSDNRFPGARKEVNAA